MDKDKCPFCGAETRPGDNFCLNCGNRLPTAAPASTPPVVQPGDPTVGGEEWGGGGSGVSSAPTVASWGDDGATVASQGSDAPTYRADATAPTIAPVEEPIPDPARLVLRSENGEVIQEYVLDKPELTIGRAPNSDVLLSKDKLTSRRHATVRYEDGKYVVRDERSANGTFVNGQQLEELVPHTLQEGDHIGVGEHELIFYPHASVSIPDVEDLPTVSVSNEVTYRTREDELATVASSDDFQTGTIGESSDNGHVAETSSNGAAATSSPVSEPAAPVYAATPAVSSSANSSFSDVVSTPPAAVVQSPTNSAPLANDESSFNNGSSNADTGVNFKRLSSIAQPSLPDMTALMASLSSLDGQVMALQQQLNTTQDALRSYEGDIANTANQLRSGVRRVSERMDSTIADVARSREALAWAELLQLMEDVMNNPRDIEYVTKLARKARELNKVFQLHQNVLNTMAECNSLLRSMISDDK